MASPARACGAELNTSLVLIVHDRRVALPAEERLAIYELIALHGHLMDAGAFDRLDELFTDDFVYDLDALGIRPP